MMRETASQRFRAVCPDGKVRTARPTAEADTYFTIPARVTAHGRTVSGSIMAANPVLAEVYGETIPFEYAAAQAGAPYIFTPRADGANVAAVGQWPKTDGAALTAHVMAGLGLVD